jgi:hypothetical protein
MCVCVCVCGFCLTLNLICHIYIYIYGAPCKVRHFNVVCTSIYGPTFGNAEIRLFLLAAKCFNIESMKKVNLCHSYV